MSYPTIGRIVLVEKNDEAGKTTVSSAIISAVHSLRMINCRVFEDGHGLLPWLTSIPKKHKLEARQNEEPPLYWWYWPPRAPAVEAGQRAESAQQDQPQDEPPPHDPAQSDNTGQEAESPREETTTEMQDPTS